jgi:hypothetical protein
LSKKRKTKDSASFLIQKKYEGAFWLLGEGEYMAIGIFESFSCPAIKPKKCYVASVWAARGKVLAFHSVTTKIGVS